MRARADQERFDRALEGLVEQVKQDRAVLAAILCGSLSHDTVWSRSDIDLLLVTVDDAKVAEGSKALNAGGVNVHAMLMPRAAFRKTVEGSVRNSFMHALIAKGKVVYARDPTIEALFAGLSRIGERDTRIQVFEAAAWAVPSLDKARKWLVTRNDPEYAALWLLYAATPLARIEVLGARQLAGREVIQQALKLNPKFFKTIYTDLLNERKTPAGVKAALDAADAYLAARAKDLFRLILEHLAEAGEARSATEIDDHFQKDYGIEFAVTACEYLADRGLVGKAGVSVQLTRKSTAPVEELAFFRVR